MYLTGLMARPTMTANEQGTEGELGNTKCADETDDLSPCRAGNVADRDIAEGTLIT